MVELELVGVKVQEGDGENKPLMLFKERKGERGLSIWIGPVEATSIAFALAGTETPRPMTHDLFASALRVLDDFTIEKVVITNVISDDQWKGTFFAEVRGSHHGDPFVLDARPSDAVALAVRLGAPIYADSGVESAFFAA